MAYLDYNNCIVHLWFLLLSRVFTRRGWNSRNQWENRNKPKCRPAAKDSGRLMPYNLNEKIYLGSIANGHFNFFHTERNQRCSHDEDHLQPAESIPSLWGSNTGDTTCTCGFALCCISVPLRLDGVLMGLIAFHFHLYFDLKPFCLFFFKHFVLY